MSLLCERALSRAQEQGKVSRGVDPGDTAYALVAQIEGILSLARNTQDPETLEIGARSLRRYLESMRARQPRRRAKPRANPAPADS